MKRAASLRGTTRRFALTLAAVAPLLGACDPKTPPPPKPETGRIGGNGSTLIVVPVDVATIVTIAAPPAGTAPGR